MATASAAQPMTDQQLQEIQDLLATAGYLPFSNKAMRLLNELERLGSQNPDCDRDALARLRAQLQDGGYLPFTRAKQLLDEIVRLRRA